MKTPPFINKIIFWVILFAIAMGFLESAVVVYLRQLYYPGGFAFPLKPIPASMARVEFFRELSTVIMLVACGILAGNGRLQRFAFFALAFAVWDLFYYVFLYLCLGWPQSLGEWDILFLIPVPWVGPVWAPCLLSVIMIIGALHIIYRTQADSSCRVPLTLWWWLLSGAFICIVAFMWDYLQYTRRLHSAWSVSSSADLFAELQTYVPTHFNITLFFTGFVFICLPVVLSILKTVKK